MSNASVAATPSYSAAWDLAHQRLAEADARRMAQLDQALVGEIRKGTSPRSAEIRARAVAATQRYRANVGQPIPACSVCGGPRSRRNGSRCGLCRDRNRCVCGAIKTRWSTWCEKCRESA